MNQIPDRRLRAQRLTGTPFSSAVEVVHWLGAVQAQDYAAAKWALAQRTNGATETELDRLFDEGAILRTHVLRPTWHFVPPDDIRWMLQLSGARIRSGLAARYRELEIDDVTVARAGAAFGSALAGGRHLTRAELGPVLRAAGISPDGQRLPHLLSANELLGLLTSGRRQGRQFTYALLDERAPRTRELDRADAVVELTRRYFRSHGPAQLQDFGWWSGLTAAEARSGIARAGRALEHEVLDGKEYWSDAESRPSPNPADGAGAHLLASYDEYTVAYRDRTALVHPDHPFDPRRFPFGSVLFNVLTIGGHVRGTWRRSLARGVVRVEATLLDRLDGAEEASLEEAGRRLGHYLGAPVGITVT